MSRRGSAVLNLTVALALAGCAAHGAAPAAWRDAPGVAGQGGGGAQPAPAATGRPSPAPRGGGAPETSPVPPSPSPTSPGGSPSTPATTGPPRTPPVRPITSTGSSAVALTFDDGPGPYTGKILDLLDQYHIKATFCLIGRQVRAYAATVRRMVADGMTLCNHTWDHDEHLRQRPAAQIRKELADTNAAIQSVAPEAKIKYFRNPGGAFSSGTIAIARSLGMKSLMWNVDPRDWTMPGTEAIIDNVLRHTHHGSIVLSHDAGGDRSQTLAAYRMIIPSLRRHFRLIAMPTR
jgi:peptidoglycan-N-acetylglucosamine deacetylase